MYKLIVTDMDGTLLNSDKEVSPDTVAALRTLMQTGARVTLATGRIYRAAKRYADQIGMTTPLICCNGAVIVDPVTDELLYGAPIPAAIGKKVLEIARRYDVYYHLYDKETIYSERLEKLIAYFRRMSLEHPPEHRVGTEVVPDAMALFEQKEIYKIGFHFDNSERSAQMRREVEAIEGIAGYKSLDTIYDVLMAGVNKGTALERLCGILGVRREEVMAFGDNENDLEMLEYAGMGVAMANAEAFVHDVADHVTASNDEEGVLRALEAVFKWA
ncbi:Cof-type HAD-IIB family hydrolase [Acidaminobacter hydrogenoformans]|uniref:Cof subfamily of IIB subfamily of haloacid dehalogenase superfamily/HAD-superfamily hydrolase, subfamily IIB n=1 Tax=Acidaminobacter hydrogenoformans DSM 2784 TaxID=1120920 RepID=A0A1G5S459_9FIRM|nr:Cof-type HAD-IIB family hydrolase [Acidaminobacter hydrogenoformans]SCZ80958.1 hypothetical protein SAMN03080599_02537 [Acidaminobacter hydrogenoformans DSM 2784]